MEALDIRTVVHKSLEGETAGFCSSDMTIVAERPQALAGVEKDVC